jgi:hypothetical protein
MEILAKVVEVTIANGNKVAAGYFKAYPTKFDKQEAPYTAW